MKKRIWVALAAMGAMLGTAAAQEKTVLSAQIYGYRGETVYFDCMQTPLIAQEFYTNPGEEHLYAFECDNLVCMTINGRTTVLLQPGDSLHVDITYEGKNAQVEYSGTERAVANNKLLKSMESLKRSLRYKNQLLGCVALDIKPKTRIDDSRTLLERAAAIVEKSAASTEAKNYVLAMIDYDAYMSFIEYPVMYESVRGLAVTEQEIGDYWNIMDGYTTRTDAQALSCPEYASLLMRYCFYMNEKTARERGETYTMPTVMEDMYTELAAFYEGDQRDYLIYMLLRNFIMNGQEIERADALYKEYIEKYNSNPAYKDILDLLLQ
ncbi:MAG: hypothetical protein IKT86_02770 [Bacteroidaceae bacterium]|nr:hypothetical protein [Bacteroidaceae bacterium]